MNKFKEVFTPNKVVSARTMGFIILAWIIVLLGYWTAAKPDVFPSPVEVIGAFPALWNDFGLGQEIISSLIVNVEALILSAVIGLPLAYVSRVPIFQPVAAFVAKMRFVSPAIFFFPVLFIAHGGHQVKVILLALGELFFLVTTMTGVVKKISDERFDDARTLRISEWLSVWYVVMRGTVADAFDAIRDNAAMGWSMLMFVEGVVRSEGGVGVLASDMEKHVNFAQVYAIATAIVCVGIAQDYLIGVLKNTFCPYAEE